VETQISAATNVAVITKTASYTILDADFGTTTTKREQTLLVVRITATSPLTITLPTIVSGSPRRILLYVSPSSTSTVSVDPNGVNLNATSGEQENASSSARVVCPAGSIRQSLQVHTDGFFWTWVGAPAVNNYALPDTLRLSGTSLVCKTGSGTGAGEELAISTNEVAANVAGTIASSKITPAMTAAATGRSALVKAATGAGAFEEAVAADDTALVASGTGNAGFGKVTPAMVQDVFDFETGQLAAASILHEEVFTAANYGTADANGVITLDVDINVTGSSAEGSSERLVTSFTRHSYWHGASSGSQAVTNIIAPVVAQEDVGPEDVHTVAVTWINAATFKIVITYPDDGVDMAFRVHGTIKGIRSPVAT
jgi:hypothetical protein